MLRAQSRLQGRKKARSGTGQRLWMMTWPHIREGFSLDHDTVALSWLGWQAWQRAEGGEQHPTAASQLGQSIVTTSPASCQRTNRHGALAAWGPLAVWQGDTAHDPASSSSSSQPHRTFTTVITDDDVDRHRHTDITTSTPNEADLYTLSTSLPNTPRLTTELSTSARAQVVSLS
ncbi:hypothetical protein CCHR01_10849 [Colletotrichum chrysophilum]|uniref:Uncharacterized protein n=1 Tax=Colletotrichum chrysophilum TaxID=1836956 RepID=A0AAD9EJ00_9PEZI|nr:hypothetical protein CCHR01_10849 [Colletotrichum chrysophilum]